jgi:RHS repeat-associated protein
LNGNGNGNRNANPNNANPNAITPSKGVASGSDGEVMKELSTFKYDGLGRRLIKTYDPKTNTNNTSNGGVKTTNYTYDNLDPIREVSVQNKQATNYYRNPITKDILNYQEFPSSQKYYYVYDALSSIVGITKQDGQSNHNYRYSDFGELKPQNGNFTTPHNNFTYTGQEYDSNFGIYEFYSRSYDPANSTWLQQDKYRGEITQPNSLFRYQYVMNSPVGYRDWYGYFGFDDIGKFYQNHKSTIDTVTTITVGVAVGTAVIAGCAAAGIATAGAAAIACAVAAGAGAGGSSQFTNNALNDRGLSEGVLESSIVGGLTGFLTAGMGSAFLSSSTSTGASTLTGSILRNAGGFGVVGSLSAGGGQILSNVIDGDPCTTWNHNLLESVALGGVLGSIGGGIWGYRGYNNTAVPSVAEPSQHAINRSIQRGFSPDDINNIQLNGKVYFDPKYNSYVKVLDNKAVHYSSDGKTITTVTKNPTSRLIPKD